MAGSNRIPVGLPGEASPGQGARMSTQETLPAPPLDVPDLVGRCRPLSSRGSRPVQSCALDHPSPAWPVVLAHSLLPVVVGERRVNGIREAYVHSFIHSLTHTVLNQAWDPEAEPLRVSITVDKMARCGASAKTLVQRTKRSCSCLSWRCRPVILNHRDADAGELLSKGPQREFKTSLGIWALSLSPKQYKLIRFNPPVQQQHRDQSRDQIGGGRVGRVGAPLGPNPPVGSG